MSITTDITPAGQNFALFEGSSIKQFIIEQLNEGGVFIDQQYLGSNLNAFIDIIAIMLQQLQFHYNTTATESTFATVSLYENMNKLVSLFNYKPTGKQTSILPIDIAININESGKVGTFTIPRYTFVNYNSGFVLTEDITFDSVLNQTTNIDTILYQGTLAESPLFTLTDEDFNSITLIDNNITPNFISDGFFDVYVKEPGISTTWVQYSEVNSLFDADGNNKVFERRINENYNYEFKFGNGINGYKPPAGTKVIIFYIVSDGATAQVGTNTINDVAISLYNSSLFEEIILNSSTGIFSVTTPTFITADDLTQITVSNTGYSTDVTDAESVDIIRNNAPKMFALQNRLLTENDYKIYILKQFVTFIKDCAVFNNDFYINNYLNYYYKIGLNAPNVDSRVLLNQVTFQTSCGFNNVYLVLLPLINTIIDEKIPNYVNTTLKQFIVDQLAQFKDLTHNITPIDPIYKAISFGIPKDSANNLVSNFDNTKLALIRDRFSNFNVDYIKTEAANVFNNYFNNVKLGDIIDISSLSADLLKISGVKSIRMVDEESIADQLTFIVWNPLYESDDFTISQQNIILESYTYQYFYDISNINQKIIVINE